MESIERLNLGPHHALHLVRMGGRSVVVATAPSSVQVLGEMDGKSWRAGARCHANQITVMLPEH